MSRRRRPVDLLALWRAARRGTDPAAVDAWRQYLRRSAVLTQELALAQHGRLLDELPFADQGRVRQQARDQAAAEL